MHNPFAAQAAGRVAFDPLHDVYPYLATRLVPTLYHLIPLPETFDEASLISLARHQWLCNQLPTCLVFAHDTCLYFDVGGRETWSGQPPLHGIPIGGKLKPARGLQQGTWWQESNTRLVRALDQRTTQRHGSFLLGDLTKGGQPASKKEQRLLTGVTQAGIPLGLTTCAACGEWTGRCLDGETRATRGDRPLLVTVSCRCDNDNRCASCYAFLFERKLNANYYSESDHRIWHVPGFLACSHRCLPTPLSTPRL
ncbi:MAG TPA: hypothetical protein VFS39_02240 [Nitrospira sp.]|nr:hypothetical protein [Nitrospira sp.]